MSLLSLWFWLSGINLLYLTFQDVRNKDNLVDDRRNYFMTGLTFGILTLFNRNLWYLLTLIVLSAIIMFLLPKVLKKVGSADFSTFSWLFLGFGVINPAIIIIFLSILGIVSLLYLLLAKIIKKTGHLPYYPVIISAWSITIYVILEAYL